jgi:hypothetical protein
MSSPGSTKWNAREQYALTTNANGALRGNSSQGGKEEEND